MDRSAVIKMVFVTAKMATMEKSVINVRSDTITLIQGNLTTLFNVNLVFAIRKVHPTKGVTVTVYVHVKVKLQAGNVINASQAYLFFQSA